MAAADVNTDAKKTATASAAQPHDKGVEDHKPADTPAKALSQSVITPGERGDLKIVNGKNGGTAGVHAVEIVGADHPQAGKAPKAEAQAKPAEQAKPAVLTAEAVTAAATNLKEAIQHRNLWGYGASAPETERMRNILEPMKADDRKAVEAAYKKDTGRNLEDDLQKTLGGNSEDFKRLSGILHRQDGKSDEAGQIDVMMTRLNGAAQSEAARSTLFGMTESYLLRGAVGTALDAAKDIKLARESVSEVQRSVGSLTSEQIQELQHRTGRDFNKEFQTNPNLSDNDKKALAILMEGVDKRSGSDPASMQRALKLTDLALATGNAELLKETLQTASQDTRDLFMGSGGLSRIDRTFTGDDRATARDYATHGRANLGYLIEGNEHWYHTNKDEINRLVTNPAGEDRDMFVKGRQLADAGKGAASPEDTKALEFYNRVHDGLKNAGNAREVADWEAKLSGDKLAANLTEARSDGGIFGWGAKTDTNKLYTSVENIDKATWDKLKADPDSVKRVEQALSTFASEADRTAIMTKLKERLSADSYEHSDGLGRRTAKELLTEPDLTANDRINGLLKLGEADRRDIATNPAYQKELEGLVDPKGKFSPEKLAEQRIIAELKAGKKPDNLDKAMAEALGDANPAQVARLVEAGLKDNPELRARLQHPTTDEDSKLANSIDRVMRAAVDKAGFGDQYVASPDGTGATITGRYDEFINPLLANGHMPVDLKAQLEPDRGKRLEDIAHASPEERARLLQNPPADQATKLFQDSVLGKNPDREILLNGLKQGGLDAADYLRTFATSDNAKQPTADLKDTLQRMTPEERQDLANRYYTKYGKLVSEDVVAKVPEQEKFRFRELLSPTDVHVRQVALDTREENLRHESGADRWLSENWDKSKQGALEAQNQMDRYLKEHATDIDKLNPQQKADFEKAVGNYQQALKNYVDSKGKFSEAVVDTGVAVVAVGSMVLTAGASSPLVAAVAVGTVAAPVTAAGRVAALSGIQGSDFDSSAGNVAREAFKGYSAVALSGLTAEVVGARGFIAVGEATATTTAGAVIARTAASNLGQAVFKEGAQATETVIAESLAGVTRQTALAGTAEMQAKAAEIAGKVLADNATEAQRQLVQNAIQEELKHQVTATVRDRVINSMESYATNTGIATGGNVGTEVAATGLGFEDPKTLVERMATSGVAAVAGGTLLHFGMEGGKGVLAIVGKDAKGLFAGEGTIIRHADGNFSMVPEGEKYRFQSGDSIAQRPVAGMEQPRIKMESVDPESRRTEVRRATVTEPGGAKKDVVFHPAEVDTMPGHTQTPEQLNAQRIAQENMASGLNEKIGFDSKYPRATEYTAQVEGKPVKGFVQEDAGIPVKDDIRKALEARFGTTEHAETDLPKLFAENPKLRDEYAEIVAERLVYGDRDINLSNITRGADGKLHNIDSGHAFDPASPGVDSLHSYRKNLMDIGLLNSFDGQPLPEATRAKLAAFADRYKTDDSVTALAHELNAPREQVAASVARARQLAEDGHFPRADHGHGSDTEWYREMERSAIRDRAEAQRLEQARIPKDVDGRPVGEGHRDRLSSEWGSLSQPEIQASREAVHRDFSDFKIIGGDGKPMTVQDSFDHAVAAGVLDKKGEEDLYNALALVREHYTSLRQNGQILPDQAANWTHTMGELSRVLQSAEANHFTPEETKLSMIASMFSDSAKYVDTPITKGNFFTHHLDGAVSSTLHNLGLSEAERNIVTNAILAHQISPPEFMGKLYYMRAKGTLASLPEGSPEKARLAELLDPAKSPYIGRSQDGMPTFKFIQEAANRDAHLIPNEGYALNLNGDEQALLRATGNENWHVPRDPATQPGFDTLPQAERDRLSRLYRVSNGLLAGDNAQYATIDSAYKFVVIRGPGTFFQDPDVFHSLGTVKQSFDDAYTILSPVDQRLAAQNLEQTQRSLGPGGDARVRMDNAVKEQFGTTDVPFYGQKLTPEDYPKLSPADQGKLNELVKRAFDKQLSQADQAAARSEAEALTGLPSPHAENYVKALRVKAIAARVLREEASMHPETVSDDFAPVRSTTP